MRHALAALLALAAPGCASGPARPSGPEVSPTGIVYPPGTAPRPTRYSQIADLFLDERRWDRALEQALEGIREDPGNPVHYLQAATAELRLGRHRGADTLFAHAQRIYPAYELLVEPAREGAWTLAFNAGAAAFSQGDREAALRSWGDAAAIFDLRPEAHLNLARLLAAEERAPEAIAVYQDALEGLGRLPATRVLGAADLERRAAARADIEGALEDLLVLEERYAEAEPLARTRLHRNPADARSRLGLARILDALGDSAEAGGLYASLLAEETLDTPDLSALGVGLFHASRHLQAAEAFRRLTERQPRSRDAWFNYANALFAARAWAELVGVGARLLELDPLGETAALITAKARLETGDRGGALDAIQRSSALPVFVERLRIRRTGPTTSLEGDVKGNRAEAGTPVRLRFELFDASGSLGVREVEVAAPAPGATAPLAVPLDVAAAWYRYEAAGPPTATPRPGPGTAPATPASPPTRPGRSAA